VVERDGDRAQDDRGFFRPIIGDGRPLLLLIAGALVFAGGFAVFLAAGGEFLPHDLRYLGMSADDLCAVASCRVTEFMVHDRSSFGGTLAGIGILYVWLTVFPLSAGERWAWWVWAVSGVLGFATFLAYLGYGYLDTWHGLGTLLMIPVYVLGLVRTRHLVGGPGSIGCLLRSGVPWARRDRFAAGRLLLIIGAAAVTASGLIILRIGVGDTFVPEDLAFMGLTADDLRAVNPRLVPLLAHDRAGFGGGVATLGLMTLLCLWCGRPSRHLHQAIALAGSVSLAAALIVHAAVGYTDGFHLAPPIAGAACLLAGLVLEHPGLDRRAAPTASP
jgi:hypothetical protein